MTAIEQASARAKYNADDRKKMAKAGTAMPDGSYPIADQEDLQNAIHAVGRGNAPHDAIRRHIIKRAKALGLSNMIPDAWSAAGAMANSQEPVNTFDREFEFSFARAEQDGDGLTLEGYAAVFNRVAHIEDQFGIYDEVIKPGAFKRTLDMNPWPPMMFDHGRHPLIGKMPIGSIQQLREDDRGLYVRARMFDNWMMQPLHDALHHQAIPGMSFRFDVPDGGIVKTREGGQTLHSVREVRLYELGPVVFPAYTDTTVVLRSLEELLPETIHIVGLERDEAPDDSGDPAEGYAPDGPGVQGLVEDAVESLWGLGGNGLTDVHVIETHDDYVVFTVVGENAGAKYPGLWRVNYTYADGVVNISAPEGVTALVPRAQEPEAAQTTTSGTSEEPAQQRTSLETAIEDYVIPQTLDERRAYLRRIELQRLRISRKD